MARRCVLTFRAVGSYTELLRGLRVSSARSTAGRARSVPWAADAGQPYLFGRVPGHDPLRLAAIDYHRRTVLDWESSVTRGPGAG